MILCSCANVNDRKVREALQNGARTLADVQQDLSVAIGCGRCRDAVCEEISRHCGAVSADSSFTTALPQTV